MSRFLSITCDPVDQPVAHDPLERRTWCALRIRVGGRVVTRIWDKALQEERSSIYVPAFPIAEWIVDNWWMLLNEPSPTPDVPRASKFHLPWIKRHCLRSAESGLLLPALYFFNDGRGIGIEWQADPRDTLPNMPGEFVDTGSDRLDSHATESALADFVSEVFARVHELTDERVQTSAAHWRAIRAADAEEAKFCIAAGRMGTDPYDSAQMPDELAAFIETALGDPEEPLARDLAEAAEPESIAAQWSWVRGTTEVLQLGRMQMPPPIKAPAAGLSPSGHGYYLAAMVREAAELAPTQPVHSIPAIVRKVTGGSFRTQEQNHLPGRNISAVAGWTRNHEIVIAGPRAARADSERFLAARGLYHAMFSCDRGHRLVTRAYTWDQQASRAFAAELLAPKAALTERAPDLADRATVEELATEFGASTKVIEKQLENAGVALVDD